jgi:rubrerythrin
MDLFRKAGKTFERTKREFLEGKDADFVCTSCEEPVAEAAETCPHCGAATVEPVE